MAKHMSDFISASQMVHEAHGLQFCRLPLLQRGQAGSRDVHRVAVHINMLQRDCMHMSGEADEIGW